MSKYEKKQKIQGNKKNYRQYGYMGKTLWSKAKKTLGKVPFVPDAIAMYFCSMDSSTPLSARISAFSALAYFIFPVDVLPDFIPVAGYVDDGAAIVAVVKIISPYITDEHRRKAEDFLASRS